MLVDIAGGADLKMKEMEEATELIYEQAHEDANIIWGASVDEGMGEMVKVTVIATGFDQVAEDIGVEQEAQRPTVVSVPQQLANSRVASHATAAKARALTPFACRGRPPSSGTSRPRASRPRAGTAYGCVQGIERARRHKKTPAAIGAICGRSARAGVVAEAAYPFGWVCGQARFRRKL